jgi:hypothetical protein
MYVPSLPAYSVLSHEELIDIAWNSDIRPALLKRFPKTTGEELQEAHAYAYGGSVIQDLGYYPFGSHQFTNLLHYVRTGDFVGLMVRDARDVNEFAFALGAVSHYAADTWGHPAVNAGVAIEYPNLRVKYGNTVTYQDNPEAHLKTEFSFDVVQVAKHRYIAKQYHDFIGFKVSESLLERAFSDTYGGDLDDLLHVDDLTLATYRFAVSRVIPEMTQVALATRKPKVVNEMPDAARQEFLYNLSRADYEKEFGSKYRRPGLFARFVAFLLKLIPKFGAFRALGYRDPTPVTEDIYFKSMNKVVEEYHRLLLQVNAGELTLPNRNLDTGELTRAGRYSLADKTYSELVLALAKHHFSRLTPALKKNISEFFASGPANLSIKPRTWRKTQSALMELRSASVAVSAGAH